MTCTRGVSAIVSTFNRRELVSRAIESVLSQTLPVDEIVVIDDGSTDGTEAALQERFGDRIRYAWQPNAGVSVARNTGMAMARGRYFALLDSDDRWLPSKTAKQFDWLEAHPDFGMVLCDVERVDEQGRRINILQRRDAIPEDGWALRWVMHDPTLVPASLLMRREVYEDIGGFDEALRTAEDLEFHLRIARRWRIGVVEEPLVRAMRDHDGLSALTSTYDDYVRVIERVLEDIKGQVDETERRRALARGYLLNCRGMIISGRWRDARVLAAKAWHVAPDAGSRAGVLRQAVFAARRVVRKAIPI
jgi:glycosyltransferase involved in cell wall biosynthesis